MEKVMQMIHMSRVVWEICAGDSSLNVAPSFNKLVRINYLRHHMRINNNCVDLVIYILKFNIFQFSPKP